MMVQGLVMHVVGLLLISLLVGSPQAVFSQDFGSCTASQGEAVSNVEQSLDAPTDEPAKPEDPPAANGGGGEEILSQSLIPQLLPPATGIQSLNAMRLIFPALGSLLLWGSQFPTQTLIGAPPPDNSASASKVVLVLADDAQQQGAKSRVVRQDEPPAEAGPAAPASPPGFFSQIFPGQFVGAPLVGQSLIPDVLTNFNMGQLTEAGQRLQDVVVGQAFQGAGPFNTEALTQALSNGQGLQMLAQSLPQGLTQALSDRGGILGQSLNPQNLLPPNLSFGQNLSPQTLLQALTEASGAIQQSSFGQTVLGQAPVSQVFSSAGAMMPQLSQMIPFLGQAMPPPPPAESPEAAADPAEPAPPAEDAPAPPPEPAPASEPAVGQAAPSLVGQLFNADTFVSQVQSQLPEGFFSNIRQFLSQASGGDAVPAASDISEVRVRPDGARVDSVQQTPSSNQLNSEKSTNSLPLLWFRQPGFSKLDGQTNYDQRKSVEDLKIEAKLQAFERQVIAELKLLQEIERVAKEMRATAQSNGEGKHFKGPAVSPHKHNSPLSNTPVHKITREDIERALSDDYLGKLLQKELQRRSKAYGPQYAKDIFKTMKRQALPTDRQITKEDLVKMMAYAYRMANGDSGTSQAWTDAGARAQQDKKAFAAYRINQVAGRQQVQQDGKNTGMMNQGNPNGQTTARQWVDTAMKTNPRQWSMEPQQLSQAQPIMLQKLWAEHIAIQQQEQRQRAAQTARMEQMEQQQHQQLQQHRAWVEETAQKEQEQLKQQQEHHWATDIARHQQEERQRADQTAKMEHEEQQQQQQIERQRQWVEETAKMEQEQHKQQQRQWADQMQTNSETGPTEQHQKTEDTATAQERQWADDKKQSMTPQQRQWAEGSNTQPGEMTQDQPKETAMQTPQQRQMSEPPREQTFDTSRQQSNIQMDMNTQRQMQQAMMVGEATPQMPENKERIKVNNWDLLGLGGNKRKLDKLQRPADINYHYITNDYGRPYSSAAVPIYQSAIAYGGGGGAGGGGSYGSSAYGGGVPAPYGGGVPSGYGGAGAYRAAVGNDEIDEMLRQHQTMLKITQPPIPRSEPDMEVIISQRPKEDIHDMPGSLTPTTKQLEKSPLLSTPFKSASASASTSTTALASTSSSTSNVKDPEQVGSLFSFDRYLLEPYMGLPIATDRPEDPWHHHRYDLHSAVVKSGGSYEAYLRDGRIKRDTHIMSQNNLLTPGMLDSLLRIKKDFQRQFPHLYKAMMESQRSRTRVAVKPPIIPKVVNYPILELAAAEKSPNDVLDEPTNDTKSERKSNANTKVKDDGILDYFHFDDDDDDADD